MPDQAPTTGAQGSSLSPEVADYFQVSSQAPVASNEKVNSVGQEQKADADTTKENNSESKANAKEAKVTEDKKTTETKKQDGEDTKLSTDGTQPTEFEVAGTKYSTIEKAIEAVNRINGDNSRLSGDNKALKSDKIKLDSKVSDLEKALESYRVANEEWKRFYEEGGEKPDTTLAEIDDKIDKKVKAIQKQEEKIAIQIQYDAEFDEVFADPEFAKVKTVFKELVDEYDGVPKVSPKKLFERAKKIAREEKEISKDDADIDAMVEERANKKLAQKEAAKNGSASGGSSAVADPYKGMAPEVAEYFKNR